MGFRNYKQVKALCIERDSPSELSEKLDELQQEFDFIDLQFSTHYHQEFQKERYCALILITTKEN